MPQHRAAHEWLDRELSGSARVGIPWQSITAFLRLVTNPRIFEKPDSLPSAWRVVNAWLDCPCVWIPVPTDQHRQVFNGLVASTGGGANLIPDTHLAALAIEHGLELCSSDGDFGRFPGLRWHNPLHQA